MTTSDLLENCIRIERLLGQIYGTFMEQQAASPEYAALWEKTAREEHNHEQQFLLAKRLACSMKTSAAVPDQPSDELVRELEKIRAAVAGTPLSPVESFRLAIGLEERLSAFHMDRMHIFPDESLHMLFKSMMHNDRDHVAALEKAFANLA